MCAVVLNTNTNRVIVRIVIVVIILHETTVIIIVEKITIWSWPSGCEFLCTKWFLELS
jgi:hypothetical protein